VAQPNTARRASAGVGQQAAPASVSRLRVALNDSASGVILPGFAAYSAVAAATG
jgi:hypothetical protein